MSMSETAVEFLQRYNLSPELTVFILSVMPVLELRGGLVAAKILDMDVIRAFAICFVGNVLPIPFILFFIKKIFEFMKKHNILKGLVLRLEKRGASKSDKIRKRQSIGVFFFVAVPLPGTGGWTGSLVASVLEMPIKKSFPIIIAGILTAGVIMLTLTYFIPGLFGF